MLNRMDLRREASSRRGHFTKDLKLAKEQGCLCPKEEGCRWREEQVQTPEGGSCLACTRMARR